MNAFDKKLKENLAPRRISPPHSGWEKLARQLDQQDRKKRKKTGIWWIAASVVAACLLAGTFLEPGKISREPAIQVVDQLPETPFTLKNKTNPPKQQLTHDKTHHETQQALANAQVSDTEPGNKWVKKMPSPTKKATPVSLPETVEVQPPVEIKTPQNPMVAMVVTGPAETEVDRLLRQARANMANRPETHTQNEVDAKALLKNAELHPEVPYRLPIFKTVQDGLMQLAFAERN